MPSLVFPALRASVLLCALNLPVGAYAAGLAGNWYDQTGNLVVTIYQSGPMYAASLPNSQSAVPSSNGANPGQLRRSLSTFNADGSHVHFTISTVVTAPGMTVNIWNDYDLDLSADGLRLTGTNTSHDDSGNGPSTFTVTLFSR